MTIGEAIGLAVILTGFVLCAIAGALVVNGRRKRPIWPLHGHRVLALMAFVVGTNMSHASIVVRYGRGPVWFGVNDYGTLAGRYTMLLVVIFAAYRLFRAGDTEVDDAG